MNNSITLPAIKKTIDIPERTISFPMYFKDGGKLICLVSDKAYVEIFNDSLSIEVRNFEQVTCYWFDRVAEGKVYAAISAGEFAAQFAAIENAISALVYGAHETTPEAEHAGIESEELKTLVTI